ncbi:MAG TPA: isoamylase [Bryobacteraceae bacterium]|nr:isoamylase [Bryobacteraceae bacterium]
MRSHRKRPSFFGSSIGFVLLLSVLLTTASLQAKVNRLNLGAHFDSTNSQITFRVYSSRAIRIELDLYSAPAGVDEAARIPLVLDNASMVWSTTVPVSHIQQDLDIAGPVYYGYRAWGPNWTYDATWTKGSQAGFVADVDAQGNRFNPNKLLFDPYAVELSQDPETPTQTDGTVYASGAQYRLLDSGRVAPKGIVLAKQPGTIGPKPTRALKDDIIYEVHLRGLTEADSLVAQNIRGTFAGAAQKAGDLKKLGVTAVEFLPVQETQNDANELTPNSNANDNYWGYATLDYFAPDRRYSSDKTPGGPTREFRQMVNAFHTAGLKVFIDVVYNHTGEGYAWNPTDTSTYNILSYRGLDNITYYSLTSDFQNSWDDSGVGGNYNTFNPVAQDLIVDSLVYWRDELGVDGFRFDLASILGDTCQDGCFQYDKLASGTALNRIPRELSPRAAAGGPGIDLIAEPWAPGGGSETQQQGNFPSGWSEWNGRFRDTVRESQNKLGVDITLAGDLATRFAGSSDLFQNNGRFPWNSVNLIVVHDGFTLADLYRYNGKNNNQAYPWGPSDGGNDNNISWDQGGDPVQQRKAARNGLALLMLSAGTPIMTGGDEFLRTLQGNNNAYNLDTSANWLNYTLSSDQETYLTFTQRLLAFRSAHSSLRPANFYSTQELQWFRPDGGVADNNYFQNPDNHALAWMLSGVDFQDSSPAIYIAYNAWSGDVPFQLPAPPPGKTWARVMDTAPWMESEANIVPAGSEQQLGAGSVSYTVGSHSVFVAIAK